MCVSLEKEVTRKPTMTTISWNMSDKCLDCQSGVARMQPSERENHTHEGSDSSSNYISVIIHIYMCVVVFWCGFERKNIVRMVRMPRASRMSNAFPAVRSAVCSSYSPKVPFTTRKRTSSRYSDTVRGYGTKSTTTTTLERKKEREEKRKNNTFFPTKREKPGAFRRH